jgi:hypothetical protein
MAQPEKISIATRSGMLLALVDRENEENYRLVGAWRRQDLRHVGEGARLEGGRRRCRSVWRRRMDDAKPGF